MLALGVPDKPTKRGKHTMDIFVILVALALVATAISLVLGMQSMARGGEYDKQHSGRYMRLRIVSQGAAFALLLLALLVKGLN